MSGAYAKGFGKWARAALGGRKTAMAKASTEMKEARDRRVKGWSTDDELALRTCAVVVRIGKAAATARIAIDTSPKDRAAHKALAANERRFEAFLRLAAAEF